MALGKHKEKYGKGRGHLPTLLCKVNNETVIVTHEQVKKYIEDPVFNCAMEIYNKVKLWGMPNGNGWANEDILLIDAITAIELEAKAIEQEELENASNK